MITAQAITRLFALIVRIQLHLRLVVGTEHLVIVLLPILHGCLLINGLAHECVLRRLYILLHIEHLVPQFDQARVARWLTPHVKLAHLVTALSRRVAAIRGRMRCILQDLLWYALSALDLLALLDFLQNLVLSVSLAHS